MKNNPLFVDSTKFHGDLISTQIELRHVLLYDGESLYVIVTNHKGDSKRLPMKPLEETSYFTRLQLNHQTLISYRFVIEKDERPFLFSKGFKTRAQYAVIADWEPSDEDPSSLDLVVENSGPVAMPPMRQAPATPPVSDWPGTQVASIRSILDKFGF